MSQFLWKKVITPDFSLTPEVINDSVFGGVIENVRRISMDNSEIHIPDPKAVRSMTRAAIFLSSMIFELQPILKGILAESPFSVGIYCALENGPIDGPSTVEIMARSGGTLDFKFAEAYRKLRNPKMYLKQLPNLAAAQFGISMGIQGPMNVYTHSAFGSLQAAEQAAEDLKNGRVKAAVIMSAHAFDDMWIVRRSRKQDSRTLCEGAALFVATADTDISGVLKKPVEDSQNFYGIADSLIQLCK